MTTSTRRERQAARGRRGGWLRLVLFNLIFIVVPIGIYFVFYVDARVEQTTVRNFRALDAAAKRLVEIIENVPRIAENVPVPPGSDFLAFAARSAGGDQEGALLTRLTEQYQKLDRLQQEQVALQQSLDLPPASGGPARIGKAEPEARAALSRLSALRANQAQERRATYELQRQLMSKCDAEDNVTLGNLTAIDTLHRAYAADFAAAASSTSFRVVPLVLTGADEPRDASGRCDLLAGLDAHIRLMSDHSAQCTGGSTARRLRRTAAGIELDVEDCRTFSERSPQLSRALAGTGVGEVLDQYGVRVVIGLDTLARHVAANVAPLFDQYLITDAAGRMLYVADVEADGFRYDSVTGAPLGRRDRLDFVSQVDLRALVQAEGQAVRPAIDESLAPLRPGPGGSDRAAESGPGREWSRYGIHSRLERFTVADIGFSAFVHPFVVDRLKLQTAAEESAADDGRTVLYMIGIVNRDSLNRESLKLRLSLVGDALLLIGGLFASMSLIWLWTAGDRLMLGRRHLLLLLVTGFASTFLFSLFLLHVTSRFLDARALDQALVTVSERIRQEFAVELEGRLNDLVAATVEMAAAGEAPARAEPHPIAAGQSFQQIADQVDARFTCRPTRPEGQPPWPVKTSSGGGYPRFDLAFLLDDAGVQWQCLSYRLFDTRPLDLGFRGYFRNPRDGRLWKGDETLPAFFIERVTSVLDGTTETVLAAPARAVCAAAGEDAGRCAGGLPLETLGPSVIIGRLHSLEESILPPHLRFAVVDNRTGSTLFHSVRSRSLAENFIKQTEGDRALLALMDAGSQGLVDLSYNGTSIRAFAAPLGSGVPWTLVVYRGHELEDTLGVMAVSATATTVAGSWLLLVLGGAIVWLALKSSGERSRLPSLAALRPPLPWMTLVCAGALVVVAIWFPAAAGALALAILLATLVVFVLAGRRREAAESAVSNGGAGSLDRKALVVVSGCLLVLAAVLPTAGWFFYYRADVSAGFGDYLHDVVTAEVTAKCQRHRNYARRYKGSYAEAARVREDDAGQWTGVFDHGWTLAPSAGAAGDSVGIEAPCAAFDGASIRQAAIDRALDFEPRAGGGSLQMLSQVASFSDLADDLVVRSAAVPTNNVLSSPGAVLDTLLGQVGGGWWSRIGLELMMLLALFAFFGLLLAGFVTSSLVDRLLGARLCIALLSEAHVARPPSSWMSRDAGALRACVVHKSEHLCRLLIGQLLQRRFGSVQRLHWNGTEIRWELQRAPAGASEARPTRTEPEPDACAPEPPPGRDDTLHVIEGLERLLTDAAARSALLPEMERLIDDRQSLLVCSRVLPGYWLARLTEEAVGDAHAGERVTEGTRWSHVIGPLDVRRIRDRRELLEQRFEKELAAEEGAVSEPIRAVMLEEGIANPDLLKLAAAVSRQESAAGSSVTVALQRFTAGAAGHFHELWAASSYEERLQLYSLARGGFANPTQTAVLASLANRGLITSEGTVRLRSRAFGGFIRNNLAHDALLAWRDEGHGNLWRSIWPPLVVIVVLALAFFVSSTPEALAPLAVVLAAGLGAVPVIGSLIRSVRDLRQSPGQSS